MDEVIAELDLDQDLANALLGRTNGPNQLALLYDLIRAYDKPDWVGAAAIGQDFHLGISELSTAYVKAVEWADAAVRA